MMYHIGVFCQEQKGFEDSRDIYPLKQGKRRRHAERVSASTAVASSLGGFSGPIVDPETSSG
jgi:hypothetical protein